MARVVVVGGGFAGLAVAARLGRGRHHVVLLERADELGGGLRDLQPVAGRGEDSREHAVPASPPTFTMPAVVRDLFRKTGKPIEDVLEIAPVDPARRYVFADGTTLELPSGNRAATIAALDSALGRGAGAEWEELLLRGREMWEVLRRDVVEAPLDGASDLARILTSRRALSTVQPWRSLDRLGRATLTDARARQLLGSYATAAGGDPKQSPAALAVLPYLEHAFGVWHVVGGPSRLVAALADRAALRGVELRTGAAVASISTDAGRVTGVRLAGGEQVEADIVVVAIDVRAAARLVSGTAQRWPVNRGRPGTSRLTVVATEPAARTGDPSSGMPVESVFLGGTEPEIRATRHRTDGATNWTVTTPAPTSQRTDWRTPGVASTRARALLDLLARRGLDLRTAAIATIQTPADLEDNTGAPGGEWLGAPPHGVRGALLRAPNRSGISGLYAVGASAHPGPGLPFVGLSAALVNDLIGPAPRAGRPTSTPPD